MIIIYILVVMAICYVLGCFQTGFYVGKLNGIDIREHGSGNAGTTNVLRTLGFKWALVTFVGDAIKGVVGIILIKYIFAGFVPDMNMKFFELLAGFGAIIGHNYPLQLKFRGGKGIATTTAIMLAVDFRIGLIAMAVFLVVCACTRYVSLSSICLVCSLPISFLIFYPGRYDLFILSILYAASAIYRHRANIVRLKNGTESKLTFRSPK